MMSIRKPGWPTCWRGFLIIPPAKSPICFRGRGKPLNNPRPPPQRKTRSSRQRYGRGLGRMRTEERQAEENGMSERDGERENECERRDLRAAITKAGARPANRNAVAVPAIALSATYPLFGIGRLCPVPRLSACLRCARF
jgi:hypothetical protein